MQRQIERGKIDCALRSQRSRGERTRRRRILEEVARCHLGGNDQEMEEPHARRDR
jgi:hypothetical protein